MKNKHQEIMQYPDRTKQPKIKTIQKVELLSPEEIRLDNGIPLYSFNTGTQEVLKIECVFDAGSWYQKKKLTAFSTLKMLTEGTANHSAAEIAEIFDSCGAFIEVENDKDHSYVSLYTLNKHLEKLLPLFAEIIRESIFPQHELNVLLANAKQEQMVLLQKVNYLARVKFTEQLFGESHPYGQTASIEDYDAVDRNDLVEFHSNHYHAGNVRIIVSGKISSNSLTLINNCLGDKGWATSKKNSMNAYEMQQSKEQKIFVLKEGALQSGIRIGKILFTKQHPDYFGMSVLVTILGGYFGSRLMSNIRENKGYTYGIGAGMVILKNSGYFSIGTEVGADVRQKAVEEIYKEISLLRNELVKKKELNLVRNYMIGSFLRSVDGPFALADKFLSILDDDVDFNGYFNSFIQTIKNITPQDLQILANKYFEENSFYETIVGK